MNDQLVLELYTRDIGASVAFYQRFGFRLLRAEAHFVELGWDQAQIYLEEIADAPAPNGPLVGNVRVLVPDVDRYWTLAQELGCTVIRPIEARYYGLSSTLSISTLVARCVPLKHRMTTRCRVGVFARRYFRPTCKKGRRKLVHQVRTGHARLRWTAPNGQSRA